MENKQVGEDLDRPKRYSGRSGDLLDALENDILSREEMIGAYKMNIIKYVARFDKKNGLQDLNKACVYMSRLMNYLDTEDK